MAFEFRRCTSSPDLVMHMVRYQGIVLASIDAQYESRDEGHFTREYKVESTNGII